VLSAIVEIKVQVSRAEEIIKLVWEVEKRIDTVVSIGAGVRCDAQGNDTVVARSSSASVMTWRGRKRTSASAAAARPLQHPSARW
jgi:molybdopterin-guanine dinucleotide biosynthesis protein